MALTKPKPLPTQPHVPLVTIDLGSGMVAVPKPWVDWLASVDAALRLVTNAPTSAANDAAAAAAGIPVGGFYRNGSVVQIRVT